MKQKRDYARGLWVSITLVLIAVSSEAWAIERSGSIGTSVLFPIQVKPNAEYGDTTFAMDMAYFFEEQWAGFLSLDFGLAGANLTKLAVGPQLYLLQDVHLTPYVAGRFLYALNRKREMGWRMTVGVEWNMRRFSGLDNLRLTADTGVSQFLLETARHVLVFEVLRIGALWTF